MGDIIKLENKTITKEETNEIVNLLNSIMPEDTDEQQNILSAIGTLIEMDEKNFELIAPGILQSFQQSINNPNDKLMLAQSANAAGQTAEDMAEGFEAFIKVIDGMEDISQQKKDFFKSIFASIINAVNETEGIAKRLIQIPVELCHENAKIPQYAHISDSGMDVYALDDYTIYPGQTILIPTGIKLAIPPGYEIQVRPKSGVSLKTKLRISNTPGTVDAGYRDEIGVLVDNIDPPIRAVHPNSDGSVYSMANFEFGQSYTIGKGQKFCQLVLMEVPKAALYRVESVSEIGENRNGGFGSTGLT